MYGKSDVKEHWEAEVCGSRYGSFEQISKLRYESHPYLAQFADFENASDKKVLEIGLGTGADFENWLINGAIATGVDLTEAAVETTLERVRRASSPVPKEAEFRVMQADAEDLPFDNGSFDIVYSFGVLHVTPDTERAFREAFRVLRPGGTLKAMIYRVPSWVGFMMWMRFGLLKGRMITPRQAIYHNLESPGTKAYSTAEAREFIKSLGASSIAVRPQLAPGDLLDFEPSDANQGRLFTIVKYFYPRFLVRAVGNRLGFHLLIEAKKPST